MRIKVSEYIALYAQEHGIEQCFSVTGGGAMHLNDAFGHSDKIKTLYNHHEQACAIAAEAYARVNNKPALLCVTTGPGGTNALTGVLGAYLDSVPMLVVSGQVRYDTTVRWTKLNLRSVGDQEFDITRAVKTMTKYAEMVIEPESIKMHLDKAFHLMMTGRRGPVWLDIPMNVQAAMVDTDTLIGYNPHHEDFSVTDSVADSIIKKLTEAERPVIYAGNGIRLAGANEIFLEVIDKLNIPVVTTWDGIDNISTDHPLYVGRGGNMGDRAGNFAVQNSDVIFSVGNRLSIRQVGFNYKTWAREAFVIANDIDPEELKKPTIHVEMPVCADAYLLLEKLKERMGSARFEKDDWLKRCCEWKEKYPVVTNKHHLQEGLCNVYSVIDKISRAIDENTMTVVGNGSACVVGSQAYVIKRGGRFIINSAVASMGYDLPAAIGVYKATEDTVILVTGEGSIQMNLQELQTVKHHDMPIKIFLINNGGYHSIRQTQNNFFERGLVGVGEGSFDLSFPDMEKLAYAYGIDYISANENGKVDEAIKEALSKKGAVICEFFVDREQKFEPKSATKRLPDGRLVSAPLEDMAPFLERDEFLANMIIKPVCED